MKTKQKRQKKHQQKTPEREDNRDEHPNREDDPGAWSDQDSDWILDGRMPN